ncbi:hypothetical protein [Corynebacterium sp. CNJ-954]|uniref:hypothetical protein n=1 Tax=Corynebacterium sp. CNJ-954 TaxID=1904962 RepID=UPI00130171AE|nr:hypothetical protein [Corynebacterium sp. CNJ-954]
MSKLSRLPVLAVPAFLAVARGVGRTRGGGQGREKQPGVVVRETGAQKNPRT